MENNLVSELNHIIFRYIINLYREDTYTAINQTTLSSDVIENIKSLKMEDFERLSSFKTPIADISFSEKRIQHLLTHIKHESARDDLIDRMIKMDASQAMLEALCGIDHKTFRHRRNQLGMSPASAGRPSALTENQSILVNDLFKKYKEENDVFIRYYKVGLESGFPLSQIWQYMQSVG